MSISKIAIIVGASIITAGSTAAVATRDKWLPKSEEKNQNKDLPPDNGISSDLSEAQRKAGETTSGP